MLETNNFRTREIEAYPYAGHTFICNDIVGIADVQEAMDSALNVIRVGRPVAQGYTRMHNSTVTALGSTNQWLAERPVCGHVDGLPAYPRLWSSPSVFELHPQLLNYCLVVTARLMDGSEFKTANNILPGNGGDASLWSASINGYNLGGAASTQLVNRFYTNRNYYLANSGIISGAYTPTAQDINWALLPPIESKFKTITIIGTIEPGLFINQNTANVGVLNFVVDYPLFTNGGIWPPTITHPQTGGAAIVVAPEPHPLSGVPMACDGIADFQLYLYR